MKTAKLNAMMYYAVLVYKIVKLNTMIYSAVLVWPGVRITRLLQIVISLNELLYIDLVFNFKLKETVEIIKITSFWESSKLLNDECGLRHYSARGAVSHIITLALTFGATVRFYTSCRSTWHDVTWRETDRCPPTQRSVLML